MRAFWVSFVLILQWLTPLYACFAQTPLPTNPPATQEATQRKPGEFLIPTEEHTHISTNIIVPQMAQNKKVQDPHPIMPDAVLVETKVGDKNIQVFHHVNSSYRETHPIFSPDGQTLFFARSHSPDNIGGHDDPQDIYFSTRHTDGSWTTPENMKELNNSSSNGVTSISTDGNSLLVINSYKRGFGSSSDVAVVRKTPEGKWGKPEGLYINNYYNYSEYADFIWTPDGKALIMALHRKDSIGGMDLYVSYILSDGDWSEPQNLGVNVNSTKDEFAPYLSSDGQTLYFSSEGHKGYGQADVFRVHRLSDTNWTEWSKAENLGSHINSAKWEAYFTVANTGNICYVRSTSAEQRDSDLIHIVFSPQELESVIRDANTSWNH
jgi:hypothetical protein